MASEIARVVGVVALLGIAAAIATPKGKLPLALRGVYRIMKKDLGDKSSGGRSDSLATNLMVPLWKRLLAFFLVFIAIGISMI